MHGFNWRARLEQPTAKAFVNAAGGAAEYFRNPRTPGNDPEKLDDPRQTLGRRFREHSHRLARSPRSAPHTTDTPSERASCERQ
ncbi:hypothetical protein ACWDCL_15520 [Streptomyces sp. NPDC001009]